MKKVILGVISICVVIGYVFLHNQGEKIELHPGVSSLKNAGCNYFANSMNDKERQILKQIDPVSFEVLYCDVFHSYHSGVIRVYSKDKKNVYFNDQVIIGADPDTFTLLENQEGGCYYAKDKNRLYKDNKPVSFPVDLATFNCMDTKKSDNTYLDGIQYTYDKNQIYFLEVPINGAGPQTFKVIDVDYALDKNHVYYQDQIIKDANPVEFESLPHPQHVYSNALTRHFVEYGRDKHAVYFKNIKLIDADPESFELLTDPNVGKDQYVKDKRYVYISGKRLAGADPKTFKVFDEHASLFYKGLYAKDSKSVYFGDQLIKDAQAQFFQSISVGHQASGYFKDKKQVYYDGKILKNIDVASFTPAVVECYFPNSYFKDQKHVYQEGVLTPFDAKTFVVLGDGYVKDHNFVYYKDLGRDYRLPWQPVNGADAMSFQLRKSSGSSCYGSFRMDGSKEDAKDKFFLYEKGKKVQAVSEKKTSES